MLDTMHREDAALGLLAAMKVTFTEESYTTETKLYGKDVMTEVVEDFLAESGRPSKTAPWEAPSLR